MNFHTTIQDCVVQLLGKCTDTIKKIKEQISDFLIKTSRLLPEVEGPPEWLPKMVTV